MSRTPRASATRPAIPGLPSPTDIRLALVRCTITVCAFIAGALVFGTPSRAQSPSLRISPPDSRGWRFIEGIAVTNRVHVLQQSSNIIDWSDAALFRDGNFRFADLTPSGGPRFFRTITRSITIADDWKNQVRLPEDPFANEAPDIFSVDPKPRWIKFLFLLPDPTRVYFQDSAKYVFHFNFATKRIERFLGMTTAQFDAATLTRNGQQAVLGTILLPGDPTVPEFGIQFVGREPFARDDVARWFAIVETAVLHTLPGARAFYMPVFEQAAAANADTTWFLEHNVHLSSVNRWLNGDACYSEGWAFGLLKFIPADQIAAAYTDGRLLATDILVTDGVPAEVPFVAGIISLVPATPNSHVAILARSFGVPFVFPKSEADRDRIRTLIGREIVLRVGGGYTCDFKVLDVQGSLPDDVRSTLTQLKKPPALNFARKQPWGGLATNPVALRPPDTRYFGGKAANFGLLRRTIAANSPSPALAFSFDLWDDFVSQQLPGGKTLRQEIRDRLSTFAYPPDFKKLSVELKAVRDLIRQTARFTDAQKAAILAALTAAGFDPQRNVRFRSSTNVEDSEQFTGAGLYDSYSGCPADDLDADTTGPSVCDTTEPDERGVFRAIQRVYASFYNDNAFIERLRFAIDDDQVGMAMLAHPSYPDANEMANGVATLSYSRSDFGRSYQMNLVSQLGAVSVTNPDGSALPEEVGGYHYLPSNGEPGVYTRSPSSLVPLGGHVMKWETDYIALFKLLLRVTDAYSALFPTRGEFTLDFEFKKVQPGRLEVKQVRSIPVPDRKATLATILINEPTEYVVFQGEFGDVFSNHRLKSIWRLETLNRLVNNGTLQSTHFTNASVEFLRDGQHARLENGPGKWPAFQHTVKTDFTMDSWTEGSGASLRRFSLQSPIPRTVNPPQNPIITQQDFNPSLSVTYATPQPIIWFDGTNSTTEDNVRLIPRGSIVPAAAPQTRKFTAGKLGIAISWYWPDPPRGPSAGYTAPLAKWDETRITGLTSTPIVLRGDWSQTYHPFHHNFTNEFLFEPGLEEGIDAVQLQELRDANVKWIYVADNGDSFEIHALGFDGKTRRLK